MKINISKRIKQLFFITIIATGILLIGNTAQAKNPSKISLSLSGRYAVIMDMDTEKVLFRKNANTKCENASTTKLLSAIVAVEKNKSLDKKVKISSLASGTPAVKIYMNSGDSYYLRDLLHAMLIPSANDCAVAVAQTTSGSVSKFMKDINKKAKKIGCENTHFGTPSGLRSSNTHYTTAYDLALITKYAYNNDTIRKIIKKNRYSFESLRGKKHKVKSTNLLLKNKTYYCVGKTGSGWVAKYCFTGVYTYKGHSYVIVTLGSNAESGRWSDAKKMISACKKHAKQVRKNLSLNKSEVEIETEKSAKLKVRETKAEIKWTSKNKKIATVDEEGKVVGVSEGTTIITAKVYGKTMRCKVKVIVPKEPVEEPEEEIPEEKVEVEVIS